MGPGLRFDAETDDLPLRVALGVARRLPAGLAAVELIESPRGGGLAGGSGFDAARGLTLGLGVRRPRWGLDYAAEPLGDLGSAHRFTLAWRF